MKTAGWSTRRVAGQVDHSACAVRNCWEQWTREGTHAHKTGPGATRKTTRRGIEESGGKHLSTPQAIFQQDNARPHTARIAQDFSTSFSVSSMAGPLPRFVPCRARVGSAKWQMPSCPSVHDLELAVQDLWSPSASGQHKVYNQLSAGPCGGMYCSWRWSTFALFKLPNIFVSLHTFVVV
ncbi:uncharacterized protein TNCV_1754331 [Trichonephila clavipes]|nr:uncharacterized protein TNCV_1754331 [Trichonephila clavipes]